MSGLNRVNLPLYTIFAEHTVASPSCATASHIFELGYGKSIL